MYRIAVFGFLLALGCGVAREKTRPPNIVFILADDLGYGELGCYGQQIIETPHINALARTGVRFTRHYSGAAVCAPARCILLTGRHGGHAYIRGNDEWRARGEVWSYEAMFRDSTLEGQRPIADSVQTLGEVLGAVGYQTAFVGKWGLGAPGTAGVPNRQGFHYFYGYNCQRQAHTLYPGHLWENERKVLLDNPLLAPGQPLPQDADSTSKASYDAFQLNEYAPELMHQKALEYMESVSDDPFLLIYASPLPHLPLQAPERWIRHYEAKIPEDPPYTGRRGYFPSHRPRATYAAMISTLDEQVGELVDKTKELGIYENTIFIFTSDNGPTYTGGADTRYFASASPFNTEYGRGKGFLYEGGIRVPLIVSWPERVVAGSVSGHTSIFYDFLPTLAEIGGAKVNDSDGISMLDAWTGQVQQQHEFLYWEQPQYGGQMAIRQGKWKGLITQIHRGNNDMELYDLSVDSLELNDVSADHPVIVERLQHLMSGQHTLPAFEHFYFPVDTTVGGAE